MRENIKTIRLRLAVVLIAALLGACAGPPVQEMSDARQAIEAAEEAGAAQHAPMQLRYARDAILNAERKLQKKAYNGARKDARQAKDKAVEALDISKRQGEAP